jgi:hypothetical protein
MAFSSNFWQESSWMRFHKSPNPAFWRNHEYLNVNKVQNLFKNAVILNLIGILVCVDFDLYSSIIIALAQWKVLVEGFDHL